jgi:long-chain fatty acid transport protein
VHSFHGLFQTAYTARSLGIGGAFTAVGGSLADLELNPSGLISAPKNKMEASGNLHFVRLSYQDSLIREDISSSYSNKIESYPTAPFPFVGIQRVFSDRFTGAIAIYVQGGGGGEITGIKRNLQKDQTLQSFSNDPLPMFGNANQVEERIKFQFGILKITPGFAWKWKKFQFGVAIDLATAQMKFQRETRFLEQPLPGSFSYRSDPSFGFGGKFGIQYQISDRWKIGYSYLLRNKFYLDGEYSPNVSIIPYSSRVSRFMNWPDRHSFGISRKSDSFLFSIDLRYIPWSSYFRRTIWQLDQPLVTTPVGVDANIIQFRLNWRDQIILALGLEKEFKNGWFLRFGYSHGNTPVVSSGLNPFLGSTMEHHISSGFSSPMNFGFIHIAIEHGFSNRIKGDNASDWALSRGLPTDGNLYQYSRSSQVTTLSFSFEYFFEDTDKREKEKLEWN